jgi:hypothetical protein
VVRDEGVEWLSIVLAMNLLWACGLTFVGVESASFASKQLGLKPIPIQPVSADLDPYVC